MKTRKPIRLSYTDAQVTAMLSSGNWLYYRDQLTTAARERGCAFISLTPLNEIVNKLREKVAL